MNCHKCVAFSIPLSLQIVQDQLGQWSPLVIGRECFLYIRVAPGKKRSLSWLLYLLGLRHLELEFYITLSCVQIESVCTNNMLIALINIMLKSEVYRGY